LINRAYTSTLTKVEVEEQRKVAAQELITVPEGQFNAIRIDCRGFETMLGEKPLHTETSHWYAPDVLRFEKTSIKKWACNELTTSEVVVLKTYSLT
jgi:hypothetical protein